MWLHDKDCENPRFSGNKGANLAKLQRFGYKVPQGFCMSDEVSKQELEQALEKLPSPWAVRSSSSAEDSGGLAFPGIFETILGLTTTNDAVSAVKKVMGSKDTEIVKRYADQNKIDSGKIKMSVVVQTLINPDCSGVAFSQNPVSGEETVVIEANWGLGETLVDGSVSPDYYEVDRDGKVIETRIGTKKIKAVFESGKVKRIEASPHQQTKPTLTNETVRKLALIVENIAKDFGSPQDIEWAIANDTIYITQTRPITTLNTSIKPMVQLSKLFSREKGVWYLHVWDECDRKTFAKYLNYTVKDSLYLREGVKMSVWFDLSERERINDLLKSRLKDKSFIPSLLEELEQEWQHLEPYLTGKRQVNTADDLRDYYEHLIIWWLPMTIIFSLPQAGVTKLDPEALEAREIAEKYSDTMDMVWEKFWNKQPAKFKNLMNLMTPKEAFAFSKLSPAQLLAIAKRSDGVGLLNSRLYPVDHLGKALEQTGVSLAEEKMPTGSVSEITGDTAYQGIAEGRVRLIGSKRDVPLLKEGEILVTEMTSPKYLPAIQKASALVTDEGGVTCHAAIAARELKKPCIIGTGIATKVLKNGDLIRVNAGEDEGRVTVISQARLS